MPALPLLVALAGCRAPERPGTFVGNPTMVARVAEAPAAGVTVVGGELVAPEVLLGDCDRVGDVPLGARNLVFEGPLSEDALQIPEGTHCGVFFVVDAFTIQLDRGDGEVVTVIADDFDLWIPTRFEAEEGTTHVLRFGDPDWITAVAAACGPGDNLVDQDPALAAAFFDGLEASGVEAAGETRETPPGDPSGRVDADRFPESPTGLPTRASGCGPGTTHPLAVPVPPASMFAAGLGGEVGWCEAEVTFAADLTDRTSLQWDARLGEAYEVPYNGWSLGCGDLRCGALRSVVGEELGVPCTVLARCDGAGDAVVTGFDW